MTPAMERVQQHLALLRRQREQHKSPAHLFWEGNPHWRFLPQRVARLCRTYQLSAAHDSLVATMTTTTTLTQPTLGLAASLAAKDDPREARRLSVTASVCDQATDDNFFHPFRTLFCAILAELDKKQQQQQDDDEEEEQEENESFVLKDSEPFFADLKQLGWIVPTRQSGVLWRTLEEALHETIQQKIVREMEKLEEEEEDDEEGEARQNLYPNLIQWTQTTLLPWIQTHIDDNQAMQDDDHDCDMKTTRADWSRRLENTCADCFCRLRIANIFDIVRDYPETAAAVRDLKFVLERTGLQTHLANTLQESLQRRLCHPGANTGQIIDVYVNAIKVLRIIDPSDRLLTAVAEPVRQYLRGRADTVRSIIGSLTGTTPSDLYQELRRQDARPLEDVTVDSDDEEEGPTMDWYPPPSIHQPKGSFLEASRTSASAEGDILAMLVSIYGSKELFVNEYRIMLADKLLANLDYNVDQEVHTLELLKLRFGEMSMRSCEVMLKDLNDSKRTNSNIRSFLEAHADTVVDAVMLSHIFWPQLHDEPMKHHPKLQYMLDIFGKEYARLKNPRVLLWFHQLGTVELEAEVMQDNGKSVVKEFSCSPVLATLLAHFEDKPAWTVSDLSNETNLPEHLIQKRMAYWVSQKVLRLVTDDVDQPTYVLASVDYMSSNQGDTEGHAYQHHHHHDDTAGVSVSAQEEEEMDVYLSYIVGMLTNLGSLPLKTIHNNLKTFVTGSDIRYNKTPHQLGAFLQRLCKEERLECGPDGMYKLFKK